MGGLRRTRHDDARPFRRGIDRRRMRCYDQRLDVVLSSRAAYLVSVVVVLILAYVLAGVFAQWTYGPVN